MFAIFRRTFLPHQLLRKISGRTVAEKKVMMAEGVSDVFSTMLLNELNIQSTK